jgi:hypothetical protein
MSKAPDNASGAETFKSALGFLPCPFCGSAARFSFGNDGDVVNVRCAKWGHGCMGAGPNEYSRDKAREGWNRRTSDAELQRLREALHIASEALDHYQHGGSTYRAIAADALAKVGAALNP